MRRGDWMITVSGRRVYPLDPRAEDLDWYDCGHHLSRICRYGGAIDWYTVAEHSSLMADWFLAKGDVVNARYALVHDGAEYVINDMIRPIKLELPELKRIEVGIERVLFAKAGLEATLPAAIKAADTLILVDERRHLFPPEVLARAAQAFGHGEDVSKTTGWLNGGDALGVTLRCWERNQARDEWLIRFRALFPELAT